MYFNSVYLIDLLFLYVHTCICVCARAHVRERERGREREREREGGRESLAVSLICLNVRRVKLGFNSIYICI